MEIQKDKIIMAVLNDEYYTKHNSYPEDYDINDGYEIYEFDTPQEFIEKWYDIYDGRWYWVFDKGDLICSGAVDPDDIETFEEYFNISFEEE